MLLLISKSCLTLCDPMDCSSLGSSVHGIFQARILEWVSISLSRQEMDRVVIVSNTYIVYLSLDFCKE